MPGTPDSHHGPSFEEGTYYEPTVLATEQGEVRYTGTRFSLFDGSGEFDPRTGGSGISEAQHRVLRQLIHFIDDGPAEGFVSGAYKVTSPAGPFPTSVVWWESSSMLKKIVERLVTWTGAFPTTDQWKIYDTDGSTVLWVVTDTISYSGAFETSRVRAIAAGP